MTEYRALRESCIRASEIHGEIEEAIAEDHARELCRVHAFEEPISDCNCGLALVINTGAPYFPRDDREFDITNFMVCPKCDLHLKGY